VTRHRHDGKVIKTFCHLSCNKGFSVVPAKFDLSEINKYLARLTWKYPNEDDIRPLLRKRDGGFNDVIQDLHPLLFKKLL